MTQSPSTVLQASVRHGNIPRTPHLHVIVSQVLVVETCGGSIIATCMERMGDGHDICACSTDDRPTHLDCVPYLNMTSQVQTATLAALLEASSGAQGVERSAHLT